LRAARPQTSARSASSDAFRPCRKTGSRSSKLLIARGKDQGYLTYAQVNDHLPSEIVDPEQIEDIVNTINDMGIPVYEKAPDTESLLATEPSAPADEEAIEEAAAALAALDAELGRTTDPVRMYMREMGTVELLTREGEIRIAKRIEEGLDAVRSALALYPPHLRLPPAGLRAGEGGPGAPGGCDRRLHRSERAGRHRTAAEPDQGRGDRAGRKGRRGRGRGGSRRRRGGHRHRPRSRGGRGALRLDREDLRPGARLHRQARRARSQDAAPAQAAGGRVHGAAAVAAHVRSADSQPAHARGGGSPAREGDHDHRGARRRHAAQGLHRFVPEERDQLALARTPYQGGKKYSAPLARFKDEIERRQRKLEQLEGGYHLTINDVKEVNRDVSIGEAKARRAKKEMVEANLRLVIPSPRSTPTAACSSSTSSRKATSA